MWSPFYPCLPPPVDMEDFQDPCSFGPQNLDCFSICNKKCYQYMSSFQIIQLFHVNGTKSKMVVNCLYLFCRSLKCRSHQSLLSFSFRWSTSENRIHIFQQYLERHNMGDLDSGCSFCSERGFNMLPSIILKLWSNPRIFLSSFSLSTKNLPEIPAIIL